MDREYDVVGGYLPSFVQHLKDTSARLGLRIGSPANEVQDNEGSAAETHADSSGWTPAEQNAFFRAVSVHSRWRPDLVAACVPTRSAWEVWMYLEALEEGAAALGVRGGDGGDVDMDVKCSGSGSGSDSDTDEDEGDDQDRPDAHVDTPSSGLPVRSRSDEDEDVCACEPALEVSQAWIDAEERMASWIIHEEHLASIEGDKAATNEANDADKPRKRKRGRPRVGDRGRAQSQAPGRTVSSGSSPESASTSGRRHTLDADAALERKRQGLMGRLVVSHLMVLDGILRESEQGTKKSGESSVTGITHGDEGAPHVQASSLSDRIMQGSMSNAVIDPVLLALSGGADPGGCSEGTFTGPSAHVPAQGTSQSEFTFPRDDAPCANPDAEPNLSLFSPRSRRRIQKRLYMRRKRASLREDGTGTVDTGIEKLKPGKKAKPELRDTPASVPCSEGPSDAEGEASKKSKPGLTLPYKLKAQFAELGIDAAYLSNRGVDLLNLGALGRLMGLYTSLEREEEEETVESIDIELVRSLQAAMVWFVTDVIHRAIVWKEREMRLKQRSRAWRHGEQITSSAVEHAVEAVGARYRSHKAYFKSLEVLHGLSSDPPPETRSHLHRDVYAPVVHAPSAWQIGPLASLARTYEREATRTRRGTSAEKDEELMSEETDEEALEEEMSAEARVDEADAKLSVAEERSLWQRID